MIIYSQLADFQTYVKTLHQLHIHAPALIIVPDTFFSNEELGLSKDRRKRNDHTAMIVHCIRDEFPEVIVEPVMRRYWNHSVGARCLLTLISSSQSIINSMTRY
jgi:DNA mismatch repair protein MSH4